MSRRRLREPMCLVSQLGINGDQGSLRRRDESREGTFRIWVVANVRDGFEFQNHTGSLSSQERKRSLRFVGQVRRDRWAASRVILRATLAEVLDAKADGVVISTKCVFCGDPSHGKPHVDDCPGLDVSVSHDGDTVAIGISRAGQIGIDLERPDADLSAAAAVYCSKGELRFLTLPGDAVRAWARKEAVLKASGKGLSVNPREVEVINEGGWCRTVRHESGLWSLSDAPISDLGAVLATASEVTGGLVESPRVRQIFRFGFDGRRRGNRPGRW